MNEKDSQAPTDPAGALSFDRISAEPSPENAAEYRVRMRDGIHLATDVYLPEGDGPTETVLIRLPYDKAGTYCFMPRIAACFVREGFAVVVQDVRGKFGSEGIALPWINETEDGYDTLEWIVAQPWSNGRVGMWGESYYGFTQWAAASTGHPALRAIVPRFTGTRLGGPIHDDAPEWSVDRIYRVTHFVGRDTFYWRPRWQRPYVAEVERFLSALGTRSPAWDIDFPTPDLVRRFRQGSPFDARPVPTLLTLGWFDNCQHFGWQDYLQLVQRSEWNLFTYLRIEATDHEGYHINDVPLTEETDYVRNERAMTSLVERVTSSGIGFFNAYLRHTPTARPPARVTWEQVHDRWHSASTWPPPAAQPTLLYLASDKATGHRSLTRSLGGDAQHVSWRHDPVNPVPSPYENTFAMLLDYADEQKWASREDVLAFTGPIADDPLDLCGPVRVDLTVASTGPYTDIYARLLDVHPTGEAYYIARGQTRLRNATEPTPMCISMGQLGYRLEPGHRLRLHLASSDAPEYITLPGTSEHPWLTAETATTTQTLVLGGDSGAFLTLSAIPDAEELA